MKVVHISELSDTDREVLCPNGGFISRRVLLEKDGMGFSMHHTFIPKGEPQHWCYKNHLEACYCVSGEGVLTNVARCEQHLIEPGSVYVLDNHDDHLFQAVEDVVLISIFNPPVTGKETHDKDGSYSLEDKNV